MNRSIRQEIAKLTQQGVDITKLTDLLDTHFTKVTKNKVASIYRIYRVKDGVKTLLYVGKDKNSANPGRRVQEHMSNRHNLINGRHQTIDLALATLPLSEIELVSQDVEWCDANAIEADAIRDEGPIYNSQLAVRDKQCSHCGVKFSYMRALATHEQACQTSDTGSHKSGGSTKATTPKKKRVNKSTGTITEQ